MLNKIRDVLKNLKQVPNGELYFSDPRYKALPFSESNFHEIPDVIEGVFGFVDAGNSCIINAPNLNISLLRTYFCVMKGNKTIIGKKNDAMCIVIPRGNEYVARLISSSDRIPETMEFSMDDKTLKDGVFAVPIEKISSTVRKLLEWKLSEVVIREYLERGSTFLRDGSLKTGVTYEKELSEKCYAASRSKDIGFFSVNKNPSLLTTTGKNFLDILKKTGTWWYYPVAEIKHPEHCAELICARLHNAAPDNFLIECAKDTDIEKHLGRIAQNSRDARFPGYPYGLVIADQFARIRKNETLYYKQLFKSLLKAGNVHEKLDRMYL